MNASHIKELALTLGNGIAIILAVIYLKGYLSHPDSFKEKDLSKFQT